MVDRFLKEVWQQELQVLPLKIQLTAQSRKVNNMPQHDDDNRSQQLDPEHDAYWQSRGEDERPEDWQEQLDNN
jgi:hypothetical protein